MAIDVKYDILTKNILSGEMYVSENEINQCQLLQGPRQGED
jgi:hypothetical protein